jgi:hypothetical protein
VTSFRIFLPIARAFDRAIAANGENSKKTHKAAADNRGLLMQV